MVNYQIIINGVDVGFIPSTSIAITRVCNKIGQIDKIFADFTTEVEMFITSEMQEQIGCVNLVQSSSVTPYTTLPVSILENGVELITGKCVITTVLNNTVKFKVFAGNYNLLETIKDKKLSDLSQMFTDIEEYVGHHWEQQNIIDLRVQNTGIKYPLINNTTDGSESYFGKYYIDADLLFPTLFVSTIFENIFKQFIAGGVFDYSIITNTTEFNKLMIPFLYREYSNPVDALFNLQPSYVSGWIPFNTPTQCTIDTIVSDDLGLVKTSFPNSFIMPFDCTCSFNFQILCEFPVATGSGNIYTILKKTNKNTDTPIDIMFNTETIDIPPVTAYSFEIALNNIELQKDDKIDLYFYSDRPFISLNSASYIQLASCTIKKPEYRTPLDLSQLIPDITQNEFIKQILTLFGGIVTTNRYNESKVFTLETLYNNRNNAYDWSDKLVVQRNSNAANYQEFTLENFSQKNYLRWQKTDLDNDYSLDYFIESNQTNSANQSDYFNFNFISVPEKYFSTDHSLPWIRRFKVNKESCSFDNNITSYITKFNEYNEYSPVILVDETATDGNFYLGFNDNYSTNFPTTTGWVNVTTSQPYCSPVSLPAMVTKYLTPYLGSMLHNPKRLKERFNIDVFDVINFDFSRPVFIKQFNSYFKLEAINNYIPGEVTECELIRL